MFSVRSYCKSHYLSWIYGKFTHTIREKSSKNLSRVEKRYIQKKVTVHLHTSDFMTGCYVLLQSFYNEWHYIDGLGTRNSGVLEASLRNGLNTKIEIEGRFALLWTFSKVQFSYLFGNDIFWIILTILSRLMIFRFLKIILLISSG